MIKNNELIHPFDVTSNESGKTYQLTPNSSKSVQPVALLRLSVFTPVGTKENRDRNFEVDASDELSCMEIARSEGYDDIKITGVKLSMSTDFKCWLGIIMAFSKYGFTSEKITLTFNEFAKMCGISSTNINKRTRARFKESLMNLASVVLAFSDSRSGRFTVTHLVQKAMIDPKAILLSWLGILLCGNCIVTTIRHC